MRECLALVLLVTFGWIGALGQDARAGVTVDVQFVDSSAPTGITFACRTVGPGCSLPGAPGGSVPAGWCARVTLRTDYDFVDVSMGVDYDTYTGLAIHSVYSWEGPVVGSPSKRCDPLTPVDDGSGEIRDFGCAIPGPPAPPPPVVPAGDYLLGMVVFDTSAMTFGTESVSAVIGDLVHGMTAVINGNTVAVDSSDMFGGHHAMTAFGEFCDTTFCGSGEIDVEWEECDDGDTTPGDGCSEYCKIESGWTCEGEPSVCTELPAVPSMSATGVAVLGVAVFGIGIMGLIIAARRRLN